MIRTTTRSTILLAAALGLACLAGLPAQGAEAGVSLRWSIDSNLYPPAVAEPESRGSLVIHADSTQALPATGWALWFNSPGSIRPGDVDGHLHFDWINGSLYRLVPTPGFAGVPPGGDLRVVIPYSALVMKDTEAPLGPYLVFDEAPDTGLDIHRYTIEPRTRPEQFPRDRAGRPPTVTPEELFRRNERIVEVAPDALPPVFPTPLHAERRDGALHWHHRPRIEAAPALAPEADFAERLLGALLPANPASGTEPPLRLAVGSIAPTGNPEAYRLEVDPTHGVSLIGNSPAAVARGLQSLRALLPPTTPADGIELPAWRIDDAPRFGYRGLALDLARNFQPKAVVIRYLDLIARYKLNTLHLHLTDDEGWRLEIAGLPELTSVAARRGHSSDPSKMLPPAHGSGADPADVHGSGYLTRQDFEAILRHAAALRIEVIPEIEMPGHARAAVKAMQSRAIALAHAGDADAQMFRLDDPRDASHYESAQSFTDNVMNPGFESTYAFIDHVLGDIASMYREAGVPLRTVHVGGDELPSGAWTASPACEALRKAQHLAGNAEVWNYFYGRVDRLLKARGLHASGWEEIGSRRVSMHGATKLVPNPAFVNAGMTTYVWNNLDGAEDLGVRLANAGYRTVLAPVTAFYFDMSYNRDPDEPGGKWAPFIDLEDAYDFVPFDFVRAHPTDPTPVPGRDGLVDFGRANIAGLEGQLWSELLRDVPRIDYMLMPRLLGLAERGWAADPEWASAGDRATAERLHDQAWSMFVNQLGRQVLPRLDADHAGIGYRIPPPGLHVADGLVHVNMQIPGFTLRYSTDGSSPSATSPVVEGPIAAHGLVRVAAFDRNGRAGRASQIENP